MSESSTEQNSHENLFVGSIVRSERGAGIAAVPGQESGYLTRIRQEGASGWYAVATEADCNRPGLVCFLRAMPQQGDTIRIAKVSEKFVVGDVVTGAPETDTEPMVYVTFKGKGRHYRPAYLVTLHQNSVAAAVDFPEALEQGVKALLEGSWLPRISRDGKILVISALADNQERDDPSVQSALGAACTNAGLAVAIAIAR